MERVSALQYLKQLCQDIDQGRPLKRFDWKRSVALPLAVGLSVGTAACGNGNTVSEPVEVYGTPSSMNQRDAPEPAQPDPVPSPTPTPPVLPETPDAGAAPSNVPPEGIQNVDSGIAPPASGVYGAPPMGAALPDNSTD